MQKHNRKDSEHAERKAKNEFKKIKIKPGKQFSKRNSQGEI